MSQRVVSDRTRLMSFLELSGLSKHFGSFVAVEDLSLSVKKGEFVSLLGPSGCGKTTTLQMIAGFLEPTRGDISIEGKDLLRIPANKRNIGIVFQSYALFPHMTAAENVAFGLEMRGVPKGERSTRVERALDLVHLAQFKDRYPKHLSGGQQQRIALARAIVIEPQMLLLDEPMSNLDAKLREDMQLELRMIQQELGITTILVTHDQNEAMALSDQIAVMHGGRIVQLGTPWEVYERPANRFVSTFLGKSNLLPDGTSPSGALSVRPEKVRLVAPGSGRLDGLVLNRVFYGSYWLYQVQVKQDVVLVHEQNMDGPRRSKGEAVGLDWHEHHALRLDGEA